MRLFTGECIVHLSWMLPQDTPKETLKHYLIHVNGSHLTTSNASNITTQVYNNSDCSSHNFTIFAINKCDRAGLSETNFTLQSPISYQELIVIGGSEVIRANTSDGE